MLNRRRRGLRVFAYFAAELLVVAASFVLAYEIRRRMSWGPGLDPLGTYLWLLPASIAIWGAFLWIPNTYEGFRSRSAAMHAVASAATCALGIAALFAVVTLFKRYNVHRSLIGLFGVTAFAGLFATRLVARAFLAHYTLKGYDRHYVVIGGIHPEAIALAEFLEGAPGAVFQIRGFVTEQATDPSRPIGSWTVLGTYADLPSIASKMPVDEVYLLPTSGSMESQLDLVRHCESMGITVHLRLSSLEKTISRLELVEAAGGEYLRFTTAPKGGAALLAKRVVDVTVALLMLALLSPFLLLAALLVRLGSRGPAIFRQDRAGMNGRVFTLYKFRTMRQDADQERAGLESRTEMDGPVFKMKDDPRVTGLGRLLRKTSIDELPQLWNVVKGDMSLVGPRPLPVYEVEKFEPWQRRRMTMRPGITGLWQVQGRNRVTSFADWMRMDLEYVDRWSLGLDVKILLRTIPAVLGGRGAY
ncbi:MAG: sugar transferase [Planctomycetes bacterium]|nr:sugar transferase [Planctomycetota bacterium]